MVGDGEAMIGDGGAMVGDVEAMIGDGGAMVGDVEAMIGDGAAIRRQILELSPIPKAAPRTRSRQAQVAQLLTGSPYKNALVEKLRLRGMGRKGASKGRAAGSREAAIGCRHF